MLDGMKTTALGKKISRLEAKMTRIQERVAKLRRKITPEEVQDYFLTGPDGKVRLSALFCGKRDLIVVHNMGRTCPYCTMWADGFNGLLAHLSDRAGFAVVSPDAVAVQRKFAASRGWKFRMYSGRGSPFTRDMGFLSGEGEPWPGVSAFRRKGAKIYRVGHAGFGPFDPFCATWPLFALLDGGVGDWAPKFRYRKA